MHKLFKAIPFIAALLIALIPNVSNATEQGNSKGNSALNAAGSAVTGERDIRPVTALSADTDGDGIPDESDNCPLKFNPNQEDRDFDGVGDSCDNCIQVPNPDQADSDMDGIGNVCESCCRVEGDFNHDGKLNIKDVIDMIGYLMKGGVAAQCRDEADVNDNGAVGIVDITYLINYLFKHGPMTPCP